MFKTSKWIIGAALLASSAGVAQAHGHDHGKGHAGSKAAASKAGKTTKASTMVCPMSHEDAAPSAKQSMKLGGETVAFCCSGCKSDFAKLSPAQKKARVASAKKIAAARDKAKAKKRA